MAADYAVEGRPEKRAGRTWLVVLLLCASILNFADRAVFSVLAQTIKVDLRLSDLQLGLLQGLLFALLYSAAGLPIGLLAERMKRTHLIAWATVIWSMATGATGLAANFVQLAASRLIVGLGEAGFTPAAASLVADVSARTRRASTMAVVQLGSPAGAFFGSTIAGLLAAAYDWRTAFLAFAVPGFLVAALLLWLTPEPERGQQDTEAAAQNRAPSLGEFFRAVGAQPTLMWVIAGGAIAGFGMTAVSNFLAVFLARTYSLDVREAATLFGTISGVGLAIGLLLGSFGTDRLAGKDPRWPAWGAAIGLSLAPPIYWFAFSGPPLAVVIPVLLVGGAMLLVFYGPTSGMIQNLLPSRMRATGIALYTLLFTLIGSGLGPVFVGALSDHFAAAAYAGQFAIDCPKGLAIDGATAGIVADCALASAKGLQVALAAAVTMLFVSAACFLMASRGLKPKPDQSAG